LAKVAVSSSIESTSNQKEVKIGGSPPNTDRIKEIKIIEQENQPEPSNSSEETLQKQIDETIERNVKSTQNPAF
jgi:hypothetical protein